MAVQALGGAFCLADPPAGPGDEGDEIEAAASHPREIKFVLEDKPWIVKLDENRVGARPNDQVAKEFSYSAIVRGFAPLLAFTDRTRNGIISRPLSVQELWQLGEFGSSAASRRLRLFAAGPWGGMSYATGSPSEPWFQARLVSDYDDRIRPPPGNHLVISNGFGSGFQRTGQGDPWWMAVSEFVSAPEVARTPLQEYAFLAGSVEDAKQLAKDFLDVYDHDFLPRAAKLARSEKTKLLASRDKMAPQLAELEQQDAAAQRELEGVEELDQGGVSDLKVKRALLKVELAGVEARLTAIKAKLKDPRGSGSRLVELRVAADIDLASLAAQRKVLDQLIDGQHRLAELAQSRQKKLRPLQQRADHAARNIERCDEILADLIPFQLVDDSVIIRPVKFEFAAEGE